MWGASALVWEDLSGHYVFEHGVMVELPFMRHFILRDGE